MTPLPIQPVKIHCPPPRDDTLSRERLNSWLERAAAGRLGLIVAEAGFGKTTLLADWAMHTGRLTTWYRLEPDDRDWLTFIRHLVAGGRELDGEFAPETFRLLHALGPGGPTPADLALSIARELAEFGAAIETGLTLIVDDYHVVDGHPETDPIMRALLDRTGPGFSIVISTRSTPRFSLGRLRARGGVMTIDGEALCFDMDETGRLFRDAYRHPLDEDLVSDLHERTEGWAALLTLVRTGLEDRATADPRALIDTLQASRGDLYEFLAEEVMGSLQPELQHFLTRVSVLMAVDTDSALLVDERPADAIAASIRESERLGLLTRPDRESPHRFHHLVREFLVARLTAEIGDPAVRDLHRSIAERLRDRDWYASAWHYLMARDADACSSVVDAALDEIIASGLFEQVRPFLEPAAGDPERPVALILRSRVELVRGNLDDAANLARTGADRAVGSRYRGIALLNVVSTLGVYGIDNETIGLASAALEEELTPTQRYIAEAMLVMWGVATDGDLVVLSQRLKDLASLQEHEGQRRYAGITHLNLAATLLWIGEGDNALREASQAERLLGGMANPSFERVGATATRAIALALLGRLAEARSTVAAMGETRSQLAHDELALETARFESEFGSAQRASAALARLDPIGLVSGYRGIRFLVAGQIALRQGDAIQAQRLADLLTSDPCVDASGHLRALLVRARAGLLAGAPDAPSIAHEALGVAVTQRSRPGRVAASVLVAIGDGQSLDDAVIRTPPMDSFAWSLIAEEIADRLDQLSPAALALVRDHARSRSERWRSALRLAVERTTAAALAAATLLAEIGDSDDAAFLRSHAATRKTLRPAALRIVERTSPAVYIQDLGVVDVEVGERPLPRPIRRKVLALLCYLASRPRMAASRDEALDALWPDLNATAAGNSLHQAIYFLRRMFEPAYREGMSAGYVLFDGDIVSLNPDLVETSSRRCWGVLPQANSGSLEAVTELTRLYTGKYALDFTYEEWASDYRETLHAAVLAAVESEVKRRRVAGDYVKVIALSQAMLVVDPTADAIELELLVAYKASGRRAAAAEQYAHYSTFVREQLGSEPPSFEDL